MLIEGFKSYKDQVISEPFSEKINVVGKFAVPALPGFAIRLPALRHALKHGMSAVQWEPMDPASPTSFTVRLFAATRLLFSPANASHAH